MSQEVVDVAIVGCGPAGLSAAINVRARDRSVNLHGVQFCTQKLHRSPEIRNYLGFPNITGPELREAFFGHLKTAGVEVLKGKITSIMPLGDQFILATAHDTFTARSVILATGVSPTNYLPGEKELLGRGVSYCATCDGALFRGRTVAVIGKGDEAREEAAFLAGLCAKVYWFGQPEEAPAAANVTVAGPTVKAIEGAGKVERVTAGGESYPVDGVFILRELTPAESLLPGLEMAEGAIKVDRQMATNLPGVFAAGDCTGRPYQLAKAVGEGLLAALSAVHYVDRRRGNQEKG
ncbi:MAG: NAD(P)/FAD-dependent oxidoreductase [Chitinophagales bacterium]